jgi:hypothetical protein
MFGFLRLDGAKLAQTNSSIWIQTEPLALKYTEEHGP